MPDRAGRGGSSARPATRSESRRRRGIPAAFHDGPRQLLDEEGHAIGLVEDLAHRLVGQVAANLPGQVGGRYATEPVERELRGVMAAGPRSLESGPRRHHQQHRQPLESNDHAVEQFEAGRVDPVHVLEHGDDRQALGLRLDGAAEGIERELAALRRRQIRPRPAGVGTFDRQQIGEHRGFVRRRREIRHHRLELGEPGRGVVVAFEACGTLDLGDHRMQGAVGMVRRAEIAQPPVRLAGDAFDQRARQPRFADAGLARRAARPGRCPSWPPASGRATGRAPRCGRATRRGSCHAARRSGGPPPCSRARPARAARARQSPSAAARRGHDSRTARARGSASPARSTPCSARPAPAGGPQGWACRPSRRAPRPERGRWRCRPGSRARQPNGQARSAILYLGMTNPV